MHFTVATILAVATSAFAAAASGSSGSQSGSAASASGTAGAGSISPCTLACISDAAANGACGSIANVTCLCTDAEFQFQSVSCMQLECQASEIQPALALQASQCGTTASATATPSNTQPFTPVNSAADISSSGSGSAASGGKSAGATSGSASGSGPASSNTATTGAAVRVSALPGLGLAVTVVGALLGAAVVF
ncbi:CFEM domain-containing protein [Mycena chlorophos]|uniref:CFEM domain-containing protein n=1 Tax=Mycena chlorophos TaxID=658473 RepID=A0A8H6STX2_MYCCL|nr:CFEM domain-containing protein [Mycena chlorophos]